MKRMTFIRILGDKKVEAIAEVHPSVVYGLPITADQDKFLALLAVITDLLQEQGRITNPIRFTSSELLRLLTDEALSGRHYKDIRTWLRVMSATTIISTGVVYEAGKKRYADDNFHVFERSVSVGKELPDGSIADANYVWLSEWQLDNINQKYLIPIDLPTYRQLRNHISKALVPLLQVWLFATQKIGRFEKRYDELCEVLSIRVYKTPSQITRQLRRSLNELIRFEYLKDWRIERTANKRAFKVIFFHGPKFYRDRQQRIAEKTKVEAPVVVSEYNPVEMSRPQPAHPTVVPTAKTEPVPKRDSGAPATPEQAKLIEEFSARGFMPAKALKLLQSIPEERLEVVGDYINYWDELKKTKEVGAGLLYSFIKEGTELPATFETRKQREERQRSEHRTENLRRFKSEIKQAYYDHCKRVGDRFIAEELEPGDFDRRVEIRKEEFIQQGRFPFLGPESLTRSAAEEVRRELVPEVSYEEFYRRELPNVLAKLELNAADLGLAA